MRVNKSLINRPRYGQKTRNKCKTLGFPLYEFRPEKRLYANRRRDQNQLAKLMVWITINYLDSEPIASSADS